MAEEPGIKGQIIGYTCGVFDLFHVGHLNVIKRAKSMCDRLIVGVTEDDLVSYKGTKAVIPLEQRLEIVQAIRYVDLAVPQVMDKLEMWRKLKFDVLFIGDDWYNTERFKKFEKDLKTVGVKIIYLPYTQSVCTTKIKEKLLAQAGKSE